MSDIYFPRLNWLSIPLISQQSVAQNRILVLSFYFCDVWDHYVWLSAFYTQHTHLPGYNKLLSKSWNPRWLEDVTKNHGYIRKNRKQITNTHRDNIPCVAMCIIATCASSFQHSTFSYWFTSSLMWNLWFTRCPRKMSVY